ncbi:MAG: hypothetical protein A3C27_03500 [Candidatus Levybacteria bacterium RIFCSPHIGHO2_02_FULL_39_36]|nr:MAG: hypothetical protein A2689_02990 [Candidatus Levybacteria bacterium RIFCSPHIGHO2_01_FULL_38_96]OGH27747.1 MAG: hypothetical protein A3C27_03500 [Candidatus Levybacteria bacterium RIFCSPHIGHO2_02_FULL_39_36]OGH45572.1 MAG: hypothetical protein A3H82_03330 [Candidatus Levybacteria bacterium RIFCSPLOWO2_02_FULL_39_26]
MKLPVPLGFDWNKANINKSWEKHKVSSREAEELFINKPLLIFDDKKHSIKEKRLVAYGRTNKDRKLTIVFTFRKEKLRVISARDQNRKERKVYE